jgi:predicted nucleotidyltransferase component of viral defense system
MITAHEVRRIAGSKGIDPGIVEKDYLLTKILTAISAVKALNTLVLKGGTALRKFYFREWRYSEDLDFSLCRHTSMRVIIGTMEDVKKLLLKEFNLPIEVRGFHLVEDDGEKFARIDIRYTGPLMKMSNVKSRVRFDISFDEKVVKAERRSCIREYSDDKEFKMKVYSIEEILAEKLRSIIQRGKTRDYYDVWRILREHREKVNPTLLRRIFDMKCEDKGLVYNGIESLFSKEKADIARSFWRRGLGHQLPELPEFDRVIEESCRLVAEILRK